MCLGEGRFYHERMREFIKVVQNLEVKEISDGVELPSEKVEETVEKNSPEEKIEEVSTKETPRQDMLYFVKGKRSSMYISISLTPASCTFYCKGRWTMVTQCCSLSFLSPQISTQSM